MTAPRIASFLLWTFTAFILVMLGLKYAPTPAQALPPVSLQHEVNFSSEHIAQLFSAKYVPTVATPAATNRQIKLKGIVYSSAANQSQALIESNSGKVEKFTVGSQLSSGARLVEIKPRSIVYELQGQQHEVTLPKQP